MKLEDWNKRWVDKRTGWHRGEVNPTGLGTLLTGTGTGTGFFLLSQKFEQENRTGKF